MKSVILGICRTYKNVKQIPYQQLRVLPTYLNSSTPVKKRNKLDSYFLSYALCLFICMFRTKYDKHKRAESYLKQPIHRLKTAEIQLKYGHFRILTSFINTSFYENLLNTSLGIFSQQIHQY